MPFRELPFDRGRTGDRRCKHTPAIRRHPIQRQHETGKAASAGTSFAVPSANSNRRPLRWHSGAGYSEQQVLAIILAIAVKTISNYANHIFHTEVDPVFAGYRRGVPTAA